MKSIIRKNVSHRLRYNSTEAYGEFYIAMYLDENQKYRHFAHQTMYEPVWNLIVFRVFTKEVQK